MENPAQSLRPTNNREQQEQTMYEILRRLGLVETKKQMDAVQQIKNFCKLLSAYGISRVEATYDGSGDSGDITEVEGIRQLTQQEIDARVAIGKQTNPTGLERVSLQDWLEKNVFRKPDALITKVQYEDFLDNLFSLLPAGWEINDGSFGEVTVIVGEEKITIDHNARYVEINSETFSY